MAKLTIIDGPFKGETFDLTDDTLFLGRSSKNDIQIIDYNVSRMHLKIFRIGNSVFVEDLKSSNGTFVNGEFLEPGRRYQVGEGDVILVGTDTSLCVEGLHGGQDFWVEDIVPPAERVSAQLPKGPVPERRSRSLQEVEFISSVSEVLKNTIELNEFIEKVLGIVLKALPRIDRAAIFLREGEKEQIRELVNSRNPEERNLALPFSQEVVEQVLREGESIILADTASGGFHGPADSGDTLEIKSVVGLPLIADSEIFGVLYLDGIRGSHAFRTEDLLTLRALCSFIALAVRNAGISSRLSIISKIASCTDSMTYLAEPEIQDPAYDIIIGEIHVDW
jgi:putative methionine-R-sulfoxide reductase with GAF domain